MATFHDCFTRWWQIRRCPDQENSWLLRIWTPHFDSDTNRLEMMSTEHLSYLSYLSRVAALWQSFRAIARFQTVGYFACVVCEIHSPHSARTKTAYDSYSQFRMEVGTWRCFIFSTYILKDMYFRLLQYPALVLSASCPAKDHFLFSFQGVFACASLTTLLADILCLRSRLLVTLLRSRTEEPCAQSSLFETESLAPCSFQIVSSTVTFCIVPFCMIYL